MCGIVGLLKPGCSDRSRSLLEVMNGSMRHRGPDGDGFYSRPPIELGMRRLKIIDLKTGDQPIGNEIGTIWTVFNGEIYNYAELRSDLLKKGHVFRTQSDTEVIVHQYEEDGQKCVDKFRGMFAFALWDEGRQQLLLARDRFGIKPLFVAQLPNRLAFASEMKALFDVQWVDLTWDPLALRAYLSLGYIPCPYTAYIGIRKFEQGTTELWGTHEQTLRLLSKRKYWSPSALPQRPIPTFDEAMSTTKSLLTESVRSHLQSDVPLGAFLSGGLDSTSVVALMRMCGVENIKTFSIGFEDARFNELPYAELAARHLRTEHYSRIVTALDAVDAMRVIDGFDEPFADSSAIPTYFVSRLAREHVAVALSGDGGDEVFAGYDQYARLVAYRQWDQVPASIRKLISNIGSRFVSGDMKGAGFVRRIGGSPDLRLLSLISHPLESVLGGMLSEGFREFLLGASNDSLWQDGFRCANSVTEAQVVDQKNYLADDILVKVDRCSMAVSLESRVPLLDFPLCDYVNGLPFQYKLSDKIGKRLLKQTMKSYVPEEILNRTKKGFGVPLRSWLAGVLQPMVKNNLLDDQDGLFKAGDVRSLVDGLRTSGRDRSDLVWKLAILGRWVERRSASKPW